MSTKKYQLINRLSKIDHIDLFITRFQPSSPEDNRPIKEQFFDMIIELDILNLYMFLRPASSPEIVSALEIIFLIKKWQKRRKGKNFY